MIARLSRWNWPMLGAMAFCALSLSGATKVDRAEEPWPALLSSTPLEIDGDIASLQLRANTALAKLMESGGG
jgi:hypothetical protein